MVSRKKRGQSRRGSALILGILVSVVLSAMVTAIAYVAAAQARATGNLAQADQVFFAAESGAQRVAWYVRNLQYKNGDALSSTLSSALTPNYLTVNGQKYYYTTTVGLNADYSVWVKSVGSYGTVVPGVVSYTMTMSITPPVQGIPTFATAKDWDNKNTIVTGDIQTAGNFSSSGNGLVEGNVLYVGTATGTDDVMGMVKQVSAATFTPIVWDDGDPTRRTGLEEMLADGAADIARGTVLTGNQNDVEFDFTKYAGTNKVIMVTGDVTDPTFKGTGTLYVVGSLKFTKQQTNANSIGNSAEPINLVVSGDVANPAADLSFNKSTDVYGALYVKGDWDRAQTNVHGMVYVQGIAKSNLGSSTLDASGMDAPWFDTRATLSGLVSSPMQVKLFTGPQP